MWVKKKEINKTKQKKARHMKTYVFQIFDIISNKIRSMKTIDYMKLSPDR